MPVTCEDQRQETWNLLVERDQNVRRSLATAIHNTIRADPAQLLGDDLVRYDPPLNEEVGAFLKSLARTGVTIALEVNAIVVAIDDLSENVAEALEEMASRAGIEVTIGDAVWQLEFMTRAKLADKYPAADVITIDCLPDPERSPDFYR